MANIVVNLSNSIITKLNGNTQTDTIGDDLGTFFLADSTFTSTHSATTNYLQTSGGLRLNYADGAYENYTGVVIANPNAASGSASANSMEKYVPSAYSLQATGLLSYHYDVTASGTTIQSQGSILNTVVFQTLLPATSPNYDATLGNITMSMQGTVITSAIGGISGTVSSLSMGAERTLTTSTLTGNFYISGNVAGIAQNTSALAVSGTATSYSEKYVDGSSVSMTNIAIPVTTYTTVNKILLANGANLPGDDTINITLGAVAASPWSIASGAGNDKVVIKGGGSSLSVNAGTGNDTITLGDDNHAIDGGDGTDTVVFNGARDAYTVTKTTAGFTVSSGGGVDTLTGIERLQFSDISVAFDISGNGGQVYRLYQAAFNRVPDSGGLGFWINSMDAGLSLASIANQFTKSGEFQAMYGATPTNADFLDKLYHNVLHRGGDAGGTSYWLGLLDTNTLTQAQVLAFFGESAENQAALIGSIGNGFTFTHFG